MPAAGGVARCATLTYPPPGRPAAVHAAFVASTHPRQICAAAGPAPALFAAIMASYEV
jgi:hypothetical protein